MLRLRAVLYRNPVAASVVLNYAESLPAGTGLDVWACTQKIVWKRKKIPEQIQVDFFCPAPGNSLYFPVRKSPFMTRFGTCRRFYIGERGNITRLAHDLCGISPVYL